MKYYLLLVLLTGCSSTSAYKQVGEEVPHYGLSEIKVPKGTCYVYVERNNGVALSCLDQK